MSMHQVLICQKYTRSSWWPIPQVCQIYRVLSLSKAGFAEEHVDGLYAGDEGLLHKVSVIEVITDIIIHE